MPVVIHSRNASRNGRCIDNAGLPGEGDIPLLCRGADEMILQERVACLLHGIITYKSGQNVREAALNRV